MFVLPDLGVSSEVCGDAHPSSIRSANIMKTLSNLVIFSFFCANTVEIKAGRIPSLYFIYQILVDYLPLN